VQPASEQLPRHRPNLPVPKTWRLDSTELADKRDLRSTRQSRFVFLALRLAATGKKMEVEIKLALPGADMHAKVLKVG
jgi:hypothetical protein